MNVSEDYAVADSAVESEREASEQETERVTLKLRIDELKSEIVGSEKRHAASQEQARQAFSDELQARDETLAAIGREAELLRSERDDLTRRCRVLEEKAQAVEHRLAEKESMLAQRAEELHQVWAQLSDERARAQVLEADAVRAHERQAQESDKLVNSEAWVFKLSAERARLERSEGASRANVERLRAELAAEKARGSRSEAALTTYGSDLRAAKKDIDRITALLEQRDGELNKIREILHSNEKVSETRTGEIVSLTGFLRDAEHSSKKNADRLEWLRSVQKAIGRGAWWWSYLPRHVRRAQEMKRLKKLYLFDAGAYLERYPDVRQEGRDPLHHYILYGMFEGREILG